MRAPYPGFVREEKEGVGGWDLEISRSSASCRFRHDMRDMGWNTLEDITVIGKLE